MILERLSLSCLYEIVLFLFLLTLEIEERAVTNSRNRFPIIGYILVRFPGDLSVGKEKTIGAPTSIINAFHKIAKDRKHRIGPRVHMETDLEHNRF